MVDKTITLSVKEVCGVDTVVADHPVIVMKGNNPKIKFDNTMDVAAAIKFYKAEDKGGTKLGNFCPEVESDGVLKVGADEKEDCKPAEDGFFAYTVEAPPYAPLDPIIIIEDSMDVSGALLFGLLPPAFLVPLVAVAGVAAGAVGCRFFMKKSGS